MNLEKELLEFLSTPENADRMKKVAISAMENRIKEQFQWSLPDTIAKEVNTFITEHVAPEVRAHQLSQKGAIISAAKASADEIGAKISRALMDKVSATMDTSYGSRNVLDAIFK